MIRFVMRGLVVVLVLTVAWLPVVNAAPTIRPQAALVTDVPRAADLEAGAPAPFTGTLLNKPALKAADDVVQKLKDDLVAAKTEVDVSHVEVETWKKESGGVKLGTVIGVVVCVSVVVGAVAFIAGVYVDASRTQPAK